MQNDPSLTSDYLKPAHGESHAGSHGGSHGSCFSFIFLLFQGFVQISGNLLFFCEREIEKEMANNLIIKLT